ncbi:FGGY-family carbohydrate kinase [Marivita sp. S0852]|uniref:FGGY-family carbohydrate kinase n=1 Tax=Marivita sp. S0852 TaxID=3373893 RepID=UPI003982AA99
MMQLALGIDLGTSGVRSAVIAADGTVLSMARGSYGPNVDDRRDPECWWKAVSECLHAQMQALRDDGHSPFDIAGLAVDGTSGSLVLTDAALRPVSRALMYDDGGFVDEAVIIARHAPTSHVANGPGSALTRALKLVSEDTGKQAVHLLHQADFIAARLMGQGGHTDVNNALKTGLDPETGMWPDWMTGLPLPSALLPKAHRPGEVIATVSAEKARAFGLSSALKVHAGTTDSIAAFLAATDPAPGHAVTSLGTTLAVKLMSTRRIDVPGLGLYAHRLGDGWLVGGASNTGGGVLRQLLPQADLGQLSTRIDPAVSSSLDYYPLVKPGERFPINDPSLQPRVTPRPDDDAHFLHGLLESMARIERDAYASIVEHGATAPNMVYTAGGGASNSVWTEIRSRVLGLNIETTPHTEAAVGVAKLAQKELRSTL